jgi:cell division protein FtsL
MRFRPARFFHHVFSAVTLVAAVVLVFSAVQLISTQYTVRQLFIEIERAEDVGRRLADDGNQLATDLSKAALPSIVSRRAQAMDFVPPDIRKTRMIEVPDGLLESRKSEAVE